MGKPLAETSRNSKDRDPKQYFLSTVYRPTEKVLWSTFISKGVWLHVLFSSTELC